MKQYIKSQKYDRTFLEENMMGPNSMQLLEDVCDHLILKPGMRVLDLGCGKGLTSVFLAREFGVTVFAADLWIDASENYKRFRQMGLDDSIIPIHAEACQLPFADEYFDAVISVDSYHYFGANASYLPDHFARLVKPGGQLLVVVPGFTRDIDGDIPAKLKGIWDDEVEAFSTFKSSKWWHDTWQKSGLVEITACGEIENAKELWWDWAKIARERHGFQDDEMLAADTDHLLTFLFIAASKLR